MNIVFGTRVAIVNCVISSKMKIVVSFVNGLCPFLNVASHADVPRGS